MRRIMKRDILTSSFIGVTVVICIPILYFSLEYRMEAISKVLFIILTCGFLYWAVWFWDALQEHLKQIKSGRWLEREKERKELMEILRPKKRRKSTVRRFRWFRRDWELIDKEVLPSRWEQFENTDDKIKYVSAKDLFRKTVIYTFKCKITGKIKVKVVRS